MKTGRIPVIEDEAHIRDGVGEHSLTRLFPSVPVADERPALPPVQFRTLNGYKFRPMELPEGGEETEALRIRRAFEVLSPQGEGRECLVELTTSVRELVRSETHEEYQPDHPIWDTIARTALSAHLWERAEMPPDNMVVFGLTRDQLRTVRAMAGLRFGLRR